MFYDKIGESCSTTGTGSFSLTQTAFGAFRTWRSGPATGTDAFYLATNDTGSIWELGYGTFTTGSPDTLTRTLLASSTGALINWATTPYRVYSAPVGVVLRHMLSGLINGVANVPGWVPAGFKWWDYTLGLATAWIKKTYVSGTRTTAANHAEEGRLYVGLDSGATHIFAASQRIKFEDKGAASYTFTADDIGKCLEFDTTASVRVLTMLANNAAGMGHGAYVYVRPYGSASNGVTFTPGGADVTDTAAAPPGRVTKFTWDSAKSTWRSDAGGLLQSVSTITGAVATGTTQIPLDDTIPQSTEGDQFMSLAIKPGNAANKLKITVIWNGSTSGTAGISQFAVALFQDSTANALAAAPCVPAISTGTFQVAFVHTMSAGTTSSTTFKVRAGYGAAGTTTFNGTSGNRTMGGAIPSSITIEEFAA